MEVDENSTLPTVVPRAVETVVQGEKEEEAEPSTTFSSAVLQSSENFRQPSDELKRDWAKCLKYVPYKRDTRGRYY